MIGTKVKKMVLVIIACLMITNTIKAQASWVELGNGQNTAAARGAEQLQPIMGKSSVSIGQMINYYQSHATYPAYYAQCGSDAPNIYEFCKIYMEECQVEGVRVEAAFCQAMKETGYLRFGGDVSITQFNFAGLGATGNGNPGESFLTVRLGVRAQIQHLKAYASTDALVNPCVDSRFQYVSRGCAPYVEWLGQHENPAGRGWATAVNYGYSIVDDYMNKLFGTSVYTTWYQGKNYAAVYNPEYYMAYNPDVANSVGYSSDALIAHFLNYGMNEGRRGKESFDVYAYRAQNKDLRQIFQNNLKSYYLHYVDYGINEGRRATGSVIISDGITVYNGVDYSAIYNYSYYISKNPDVAKVYPNDDLMVLAHFVKCGMSEGRQAKEDFNVQSYRNQYVDLRRNFRNDLRAYYLHYMRCGRAEGRRGMGCISLQNASTVYNGVDYAAVYDFNEYISRYSDIKRIYGNDDIGALEHFVNYGMMEGRQGSFGFNVNVYRNRYMDLQNAFQNNLKLYYMHYIYNGKTEGRSGK